MILHGSGTKTITRISLTGSPASQSRSCAGQIQAKSSFNRLLAEQTRIYGSVRGIKKRIHASVDIIVFGEQHVSAVNVYVDCSLCDTPTINDTVLFAWVFVSGRGCKASRDLF